jgi:parallel beta-helix repeat protein
VAHPRGHRLRGAIAVALFAVTSLATLAVSAGAEGAPEPEVLSAEDAELQAAVVAAEDRRITEVRTVTALARWRGENWKTPYRLGTEGGYTLVLTPRSTPYTIADLLQLAPQTFLLMSDGSYLLTEHLVVMPRATLSLGAPGGLSLRLASGHDGFATILSFGGELLISGDAGSEVVITSWDLAAGEPDTTTLDGRAYIRAVGGQFEASYAHLSGLGFWSGRTGGLALTGTDRPNTGAIESGGSTDTDGSADSSVLDGITVQPAGPIAATGTELGVDVPATDFVSSRLSHVTVERSAVGLFVSGANGIQVSDSVFSDNALGGVVLHRYVTNGVITRTTSSRNAGDGFTLARATSGITITESTATENAGSGFSLDGRPLADGPSAVGASLRSYGSNSVDHSTATDNVRYGVEILGGHKIGVQNTSVSGHEMGIMVNGPATGISLTGNQVDGSSRHGIALVNGVSDSTVTGNIVDGSSTGVYLRDSSVQVKSNTIQGARSHGVSVVGAADGTEVSFNVLSGSGASGYDATRSSGSVANTMNDLDAWSDTSPWYIWFKKLLQPMNLLWAFIALFVIVSALRSRRDRAGRHFARHPYPHQMAPTNRLPVPLPEVIDLTESRSVVPSEP